MNPESSNSESAQTKIPFDLSRVRVHPLEERKSLNRVEDILLSPDNPPFECEDRVSERIAECATRIHQAANRGASIMLIYGAHLLRNGAALILERMMADGWLSHLATNGAGSIHDWEYAFLGKSTENVADNVATGTFGTWDETSKHLHTALMTGALQNEGYGASAGRFIMEDGMTVPSSDSLERELRAEPSHPLSAARADLLQALLQNRLPSGRIDVEHRWKHASILGQAFKHKIRTSVHPGIGYDIIANHPIFNGAVIGRAADMDFRKFGESVNDLDGGVVLSVGSAIMGPQVFEKSVSCVNNLRLQSEQSVVRDHTIYVVDIQDGGNWDWSQGEPPKTNPAYYLRFCKSYSRMGGTMHYLNCDNVMFLHNLYHRLREL